MSATHILRAAAGAAVLGQLARTEASAIEGSRGTPTGFIQSATVYEALGFVGLALELAGRQPLPSLARRAIYFTPVVVSYFVGKRIQNDRVRDALVSAQNLFNPLCQAAAAVSCVALIWFGSPVAGTAGLLVLGLGLAERRQWIGPKGREYLRTYFDPALAVAGLFSASWFTIGFCAVELACYLSSVHQAKKQAIRPASENVLTLATLKTLLPDLQRFSHYRAEFYKACATGCRITHDYEPLPKQDVGPVFRWVAWALFDNAEKRFVSAKQLATDDQVDLEAIQEWIAQAKMQTLRKYFDRWLEDVKNEDLRREAWGVLYGFGEVNRPYVHCPTLPQANPLIDIGALTQMVNEALASNRALFMTRFRAELNDDERYREKYGDPAKKQDPWLINEYVPSFKQYIGQIQARTVKAGELSAEGYTWLEDNLRVVIQALREQPLENRLDPLVKCLVRLPYCGPGKKDLVDHLVSSLVLHQAQTPLRTKFLVALRNERTRWFQGLLAQFLSNRFSDKNQLHEYNKLINQYGGQKLGIHSASADDDELAQVPPLLKPLFERGLQPFWHQKFWQEHTPSHVVEVIMEHIGPGKPISFLELKQAWYQWIDRQQIAASEKAALKQEYEQWQLLGTDLVDNDNKYNPALIYALLIDMGIINDEIS